MIFFKYKGHCCYTCLFNIHAVAACKYCLAVRKPGHLFASPVSGILFPVNFIIMFSKKLN